MVFLLRLIRCNLISLALMFCAFFLPSVPAMAQASVPGQGGYESSCEGHVEYFASTPQILEAGCVAVYNVLGASAGYVYTFTGCISNISCQFSYVHGTTHSTSGDSVTLSTIPAGADCSSGLFDGLANSCIGGTVTCPSGVNASLVVLTCLAMDVSKPVNAESSCGANIAPSFTLAYQGCEYHMNTSSGTPVHCWFSDLTGDAYCGLNYTSDGQIAPPSDALSETSANSSFSNACPTSGNCAVGGVSPGTGTDGTKGGTGTVACGGTGQPACVGGGTGTTACGGAGQVSCSAAGSGGGSAAVCGGPGLPACATDGAPVCGGPGLPACTTDAKPVCGGPGLPACTTDAKPVCGGPGLPACITSDVASTAALGDLDKFFTTASSAPGDPVPASITDLNNAGLDGRSTFSALTSWTLPAHTSTCPSGSFSAFGRTYVVDGQCKFAADNLGALRGVMILVFSLSALFIVLKA